MKIPLVDLKAQYVAHKLDMDAAIAAIEALSAIDGKVTRIRMEELNR